MRILWFTWKDRTHPQAGGAETVDDEIAIRLVRAGHEVTFVTSSFPGAAQEEFRNGFRVLRAGNRWTVYWQAYRRYRRELCGWADVVIDEMNTIPFFAAAYVSEPKVLLVHQLARIIWLYQMSFPLNIFGWVAEPLYLRMLSPMRTLTVSESTKADLVRFGFAPARIKVFPVATNLAALPENAAPFSQKLKAPTLLALGSVRAMKRTLHALRAFERAKTAVPDLQLIIAGDAGGGYGRRVMRAAAASKFSADIRCTGAVSESEKLTLLTKAHLVVVTSVKEGWCLVVTEANRRGTPVIAYDVDGLRDSVRNGETGVLVADGDAAALGDGAAVLLKDPSRYATMCRNALAWGRSFDFDRSAVAFAASLNDIRNA